MQQQILRNALFSIVLSLFVSHAFASVGTIDSSFVKYEKQIDAKAKEISIIRFNEKQADQLSQDLLIYFKDILEKDNAFEYQFDSLSAIGKVQSQDGRMRIFTWNIVRNDGTYTYYGLLQYNDKSAKQIKTYVLTDHSDSIPEPQSARLSHDKWFGALYYEVIETSIEGGKLYTLFGWDGNSLYSSKKVIESLTFTASGKPKFGSSVFKFGRKKQKRVIFEYSRMVNMTITYDSELKMIVFDHLAPSDQIYENNKAYYGPDFSYDGFTFENDVWNFIPEVDYSSNKEDNSRKRIFKR